MSKLASLVSPASIWVSLTEGGHTNAYCSGIDAIFIAMQVELICRLAIVLLHTHYHQLISTLSARSILSELKDALHSIVKVNHVS